mgnify:CR=1 FL=1
MRFSLQRCRTMKEGKWLIIILIGILSGSALEAQNALDQLVSLRVQNVSVEKALLTLMEQENVPLSFSNDLLPRQPVSVHFRNQPLRTVLDALLQNTGLSYRQVGPQIVLYQAPRPKSERKFTISGFVQDAATGERLVAASVFERSLGKGVETNEYGFFSITLPEGKIHLSFYYLGYIPQEYTFQPAKDIHLVIELNASLLLPEIEVIARDSILSGLRSGISEVYLTGDDMAYLPALGGESDLIRTTHLLPGIQTGTDGIGGIHVRGGNTEHNLILVDGVPVYNALHAAGLFSIFNTDAIRSAQLVKGGFPARYGGRLSSVLDIHTKDGNRNRLSGQAEVGLLTGRVLLEGPITKGKGSFFLSARRSFVNWYTAPLSRRWKAEEGVTGETLYNFYDVNAKLNYDLSPRDKVYLSFYQGSDHFTNEGLRSTMFNVYSPSLEDTARIRWDSWYREALRWGNTVSAARWNHVFGNKLFANTTMTYSRFAADISYGTVDSLVLQRRDATLLRSFNFGQYQSGIEDLGGKTDFDWLLSPTHTIRFGGGITRHRFRPGALTYNERTEHLNTPETQGNDPITSLESFLYVEDNIVINNKISIQAGLHAARLSVQNKTYNSWQPRLSTYWQAAPRLGLKASYGEMAQFVHLLSNSNIGLPTDLWVPATANVPPQRARQVSLGSDYRLPRFELSAEAYYKEMNQLLSYTEGAFFLNDWEQNVTTGEGRAYGVELLLRKTKGATTGWLAYTLSWADRRFDLVNLGQRYPFKFDRRHDLKLVGQHVFNRWMRVSANWVISSGFAYSLPIAEYFFETPDGTQVPVLDFGSKNQFRMPFYHRLDLNIGFTFKSKNFWHGLDVGCYNLYDRKNPLFYDLRTKFVADEGELKEQKEFVQVWLLPFLPSVNYSIKF